MTTPTRYISVDDLVLPDHSPESIRKAHVAHNQAKQLVSEGRAKGEISDAHFEALNTILRDAQAAEDNKDYITLYAASRMIILWGEGYQLDCVLGETTIH